MVGLSTGSPADMSPSTPNHVPVFGSGPIGSDQMAFVWFRTKRATEAAKFTDIAKRKTTTNETRRHPNYDRARGWVPGDESERCTRRRRQQQRAANEKLNSALAFVQPFPSQLRRTPYSLNTSGQEAQQADSPPRARRKSHFKAKRVQPHNVRRIGRLRQHHSKD